MKKSISQKFKELIESLRNVGKSVSAVSEADSIRDDEKEIAAAFNEAESAIAQPAFKSLDSSFASSSSGSGKRGRTPKGQTIDTQDHEQELE